MTAHWYSWEQQFCIKGLEFGKVGEDFDIWEADFINLERGIFVSGGNFLVDWRRIIWMTILRVASLLGVHGRSKTILGGR